LGRISGIRELAIAECDGKLAPETRGNNLPVTATLCLFPNDAVPRNNYWPFKNKARSSIPGDGTRFAPLGSDAFQQCGTLE